MPDIRFSVEGVTPATARRWLQKNIGNRKISPDVVRRYARAMKSGEWVVNGETVKFDEQGHLIDGQHRLLAIVQSAVTVDTCVIRGLSRDAFKTIDGGRLRSSGDFLYVLGYKNPNALAAAGRMLFAYEYVLWGGRIANVRRVSNDELLATIERHPGLIVAADDYMHKPHRTPLIPHSTGMLLFYLGSLVNGPKVRRFFTELASGEYVSRAKFHPVRVLRERLIETSREVVKPSSMVRLAWTITAWNHFARSRELRRLSRLVDVVPRLDPDPVLPRKRKIQVSL